MIRVKREDTSGAKSFARHDNTAAHSELTAMELSARDFTQDHPWGKG